jgi:N6-adenosine-specific RNA methylase IME4
MSKNDLFSMRVGEVAAPDCALFLWVIWPTLPVAMDLIRAWGFTYKTCAYDWMKVTEGGQPLIGMGYWTRSNTEPCLLATRGRPRRLWAGVPQAVLTTRREHSRKPDEVRERIERLVAGPYLELFARSSRPGWTPCGDETQKFG